MTISTKQLKDACAESYSHGVLAGKEQAKKDLVCQRQSGLIEISKAASDIALANAKLAYALSQIANKLT